MFGTERGAYPDAQNMEGLVERAGTGVLFLDQFCSISEANQFELLRLLEPDTREYQRLISGRTKVAGCKFVIADILSSYAASQAGAGALKRLIPEMYSRLRFGVEVPPLRDRRSDIPLLVTVLLDRFNLQSRKSVRLDEEVVDRFSRGRWAGNVRALHDIVAELVRRCTGCVGWAQVCSSFDSEQLEPEVGAGPVRPAGPGDASPSPSVPAGLWSLGARRPRESDEADLKSRLVSALLPAHGGLVDRLAEALASRVREDGGPRDDPGRHLVYAALLCAVAAPAHDVTSASLRGALVVSDGQVNKLCRDLAELLMGPLTTLCRCEREGGGPYHFLMNPAVLR